LSLLKKQLNITALIAKENRNKSNKNILFLLPPVAISHIKNLFT